MPTSIRWSPLCAASVLLLGACSGGDDGPSPTQITPVDDASANSPTMTAKPIFFPSDDLVADPLAEGVPAPSPFEPETPLVDPTAPADADVTGITLPGFGDLADALSGGVPDTVEPADGAVLPRLQNRFRSNDDYDLWGCNPTERSEPLIVYSYLGTFGALTTPDPVTGSPENAQAATYTVTETVPGTILLGFLGLGRAEEINQFRFAEGGDEYEAFSSTFGPIACARISAGELS